MQAFCNNLNKSKWKGAISEVGIGMQFTADFVLHPGSSKTLLHFESDISSRNKPRDARAVSLETVQAQADTMLSTAIGTGYINDPIDHLFGLAVSGAHYKDKPSHAWICLKTNTWEAYIHVEIDTNENRTKVADDIKWVIQCFLTNTLLDQSLWTNFIAELKSSRIHVDVLYAPGIGDFERLLLLTPDNPLVYHNGRFHRVVDYVRNYSNIYPGAFWPPTARHLSVENCLFEISQAHYYKGNVDYESLLHRARMLDLEGRPTLLTQAPRFVDKHALLAARTSEPFTFILGTDAWNATIAHHQYPGMNWLSENMPQASFLVMPRNGVELYENGVSKTLQWSLGKPNQYGHYNATQVRESSNPGSHEYLTDNVGKYVTNQGLFQSPTASPTSVREATVGEREIT